VRFSRGLVGRNSLQMYTRALAQDVFELKGGKITNKMVRSINITCLNETLAPIDKAMETTRHCTMDAFEKYNHKKKVFAEPTT
jgi:hypothetical protein